MAKKKSDLGFVAKALEGTTAVMDPMSETWEANLPVPALYLGHIMGSQSLMMEFLVSGALPLLLRQ